MLPRHSYLATVQSTSGSCHLFRSLPLRCGRKLGARRAHPRARAPPAGWTPRGPRIHRTAVVNDPPKGFRSAQGSAPHALVPITILLPCRRRPYPRPALPMTYQVHVASFRQGGACLRRSAHRAPIFFSTDGVLPGSDESGF